MPQFFNPLGNNVLTGTDDFDVFSATLGTYEFNGTRDNDTLSGLGGDDELEITPGRDALFGGDGNDLLIAPFSVSFKSVAINAPGSEPAYDPYRMTVDLGAGTYQVAYRVSPFAGQPWLGDLTFSGTFAQIEGVFGRNSDDTLRGGSTGYLDRFTGRQAETFYPHAGDDSIDGGSGFDILRYDDEYKNFFGPLRSQGINVDFSKREVLDGRGGTDRFINIELVMGSGFADTFIGSDGDDLMDGNGGADKFFGGKGHDTVEFSVAGTMGWTVNLGLGTGSSQFNKGVQFEGIEGLEGTDNPDHFIGSAANDVFAAYGRSDTLDGADGNDTLDGGDGADILTGGEGSDTFVMDLGTTGMDRITDFEFGTDKISFGPPKSALTQINVGGVQALMSTLGPDIVVTTPGGVPILTLDNGVDAMLSYFERELVETTDKSIGTAGDDVIKGTILGDRLVALGGNDRVAGLAGRDDISGGDGRDSLSGGGGDDVITGDGGDDSIYGDGGADRLSGGDGDDLLGGDAGDDILTGGAGSDRLIGGKGRDTFVLVNDSRSLQGIDEVVGFNLRDDVLDLSGFAQAGIVPKRADLSAEWVSEERGRILVTLDDPLSSRDMYVGVVTVGRNHGLTPDEFLERARFVFRNGEAPIEADGNGGALSGNQNINHLIGGALKDVLRGLGGADLVEGLGGGDTLFGGAGNDRLSGGRGSDLMRGEAGDDRLEGGDGDDVLDGGTGDDVLVSGNGKDVLRGGDGNDTLIATEGINTLEGGAGSDTFVLNADALASGQTKLLDFDPAEDKLVLDRAADLTNATLNIRNDNIQFSELTGGSVNGVQLEFRAWDSLLGDVV
jgi:Ca2+-binding RTX toxin-like protein